VLLFGTSQTATWVDYFTHLQWKRIILRHPSQGQSLR
jgi:hypothetical protein